MKNRWPLFVILLFSLSALGAEGMYGSGMTLKDENNESFSFSSLEGKRVIMSMAYTSCQRTCPFIVKRMRQLEKIYEKKNINTEVVIVSYDPEGDRPNVLNEFYRKKMGIKGSNWHFLVGDEHQTRYVSMLLGIKFAKNKENGMIIHDNKIVVIDENGKNLGHLESLDSSDDKLIK